MNESQCLGRPEFRIRCPFIGCLSLHHKWRDFKGNENKSSQGCELEKFRSHLQAWSMIWDVFWGDG